MKDEARIGERVSKLVELDEVIANSMGDFYLDKIARAHNKPLDFPRLLYVKLTLALPDTEFEIWHDHFSETVTIVMGGEEATIPVPKIESRHSLVPLTDQLVRNILA